MAIKIVIVDDHRILRDGLRLLLSQEPGLDVVGDSSSASDAVACIERTNPDLAIIDIALPDESGVALSRRLREERPGLKILILTGVAGVAAGAMSMAVGEYVSVSSQADSEAADLARESHALRHHPERELHELAQIYSQRGLHPPLAKAVAQALTNNDALDAHARDELGITEHNAANPFQAAAASAISFIVGGIAPLLTVIVCTPNAALYALFATSALVLALLGALGAHAGGASKLRGMVRVVLLGALAMAVTAGVGRTFHAVM